MSETPKMTRQTRWVGIVTVVSLFSMVASVGCGSNEEESTPPIVDQAQVECGMSKDAEVDREVVTKVSVRVTDPDRDLVTQDGAIKGTFNAIRIELTDPDADSRYSWEPGDDAQRMICEGQFTLRLTARDQAGNETPYERDIDKSSS